MHKAFTTPRDPGDRTLDQAVSSVLLPEPLIRAGGSVGWPQQPEGGRCREWSFEVGVRKPWRAAAAGGLGVGMLFLTACVADPPPQIGVAVAGNGVATVSWSAPIGDNALTLAKYVVTPYIGDAAQPPSVFNAARAGGNGDRADQRHRVHVLGARDQHARP